MKRAALIVNPFSSRVSEPRLRAVEAALSKHVDVETLHTERSGHATELARDAAASYDAVFVYSGDGVFNEVLNGAGGAVPLGFIPGGRTNVLPRALGIPRGAVAAAGQLGLALEEGRTRTISLGRVNGRRFAFASGIGFDAEFIRRMDQRGRNHDGKLPGDMTAAWLLAKQLAGGGGPGPELELKGLGRAASVIVANSDPYTFAGPFGLRFAPEADFELGLDVIAPASVRGPRIVGRVVRALAGRAQGGEVLVAHDVDRLEVICDAPMPMHVDGEDLGDVTEAVFECERAVATVLI